MFVTRTGGTGEREGQMKAVFLDEVGGTGSEVDKGECKREPEKERALHLGLANYSIPFHIYRIPRSMALPQNTYSRRISRRIEDWYVFAPSSSALPSADSPPYQTQPVSTPLPPSPLPSLKSRRRKVAKDPAPTIVDSKLQTLISKVKWTSPKIILHRAGKMLSSILQICPLLQFLVHSLVVPLL